MNFDITSRLEANENPVIQIGEDKLTIQAGAKNILKLMDILDGDEENFSTEKLVEAENILFSAEDVEKLDRMPLFNWQRIIGYAIELASTGTLKPDDDPNEEKPAEMPEKIAEVPTMI